MPIVRLIYVNVKPEESENAEKLWKQHCAPLMIQQPGCMSEELLKCKDVPGEYISYSEWASDEAIEQYRRTQAHEEIKRHARTLQQQRPVSVKRYEIVP
jgi:heme-degrading monooxygenase HmoA